MMAHLAGRYASGGRLFLRNGCAVPANSNNKWTAEDDKRLLKLLAARQSSFSIAAQLRRSIQAIRARLGILKAKERFAGSSGETRSMPGTKRWTLDDDRRLMEF